MGKFCGKMARHLDQKVRTVLTRSCVARRFNVPLKAKIKSGGVGKFLARCFLFHRPPDV